MARSQGGNREEKKSLKIENECSHLTAGKLQYIPFFGGVQYCIYGCKNLHPLSRRDGAEYYHYKLYSANTSYSAVQDEVIPGQEL